MKTVKFETKAWLTPYDSASPKDLLNGERLNSLSFGQGNMANQGWTQVGVATVTVELTDARTMVSNKIEALRQEAKGIRAEATAKVTRIEGQINDLLALSFDGEVSA